MSHKSRAGLLYMIGLNKPAHFVSFPLISCVLMFLACLDSASAQQSGLNHPTMRDRVREIERIEMDRELLLKRLLPAKDDPVRQAVLKQIREDFRDMQSLNNKMMANVWSRPEPDYRYVADAVSQIREKATRLKSNLSLPEASDSGNDEIQLADVNTRQFRAALLVLDKSIMSFVTNPIFQETKVIEMKMATRAATDLEAVLRLSSRIKKAATKLKKNSETN